MQKLMKHLHKNEKGFTLVELMVVVVIIGVLVAIAIPIYNNVQNNAARRTVEANLRILDGAITLFRAENNNTNPADIAALVAGGYLVAGPTGPAPLGAGAYGVSAGGRGTVTIALNTFGTHAAQAAASLPLTW